MLRNDQSRLGMLLICMLISNELMVTMGGVMMLFNM